MQEYRQLAAPPDMSVKSDFSLADCGKIFKRRWKLIVGTSLIVTMLAIACGFIPHTWTAEGEILQLDRAVTPEQNSQATYNSPIVETVDTPYAMIQTTDEFQRTIDYMRTEARDQGKPASSVNYQLLTIGKHFKFNNDKDTNIIDVIASDPNKDNAMMLADAICKSFVAWKTELATQDVRQSIEDIEPRFQAAKTDLAAAENRETRFKTLHNLTNPSSQETALLDLWAARQSSLGDARLEAQSENAKLQTMSAQLRQANLQIANGTGVRDDTLVQGLQSQLSTLEIERNEDAQKYTPAYPGILPDLDAQIKDVKAKLGQAVKATLDNQRPSLQDQNALIDNYKQQAVAVSFANARLASSQALFDQVVSQISQFPGLDLAYARLVRDVDMKTLNYTQLSTALSQALFDEHTITPDVAIDHAAVLDPFELLPWLQLLAVIGLLCGMICAFFAVMVAEQADKRLYKVEELRRLLPGPIIAALPALSFSEKRALKNGEIPQILADTFNVARSNLSLMVRGMAGKDLFGHAVVLINSAIAGEGKTLAASQIALSLSQSGRRVILVDANMRRPEQSPFVGAGQQSRGLADVLAGNASLDDALVSSGIPNLQILYSGVSGDNVNITDLITSQGMTETMAALRQRADVVVLDSPSVAAATDALFLAPHADAVVQVISLGMVSEASIADALSALELAAPKAMVYLINRSPRIKKKGIFYHYYSLDLPSNTTLLGSNGFLNGNGNGNGNSHGNGNTGSAPSRSFTFFDKTATSTSESPAASSDVANGGQQELSLPDAGGDQGTRA